MNWTDGSGRLTLDITLAQARGAHHQGQCDVDVLALSQHPMMAAQLAALDLEQVRSCLREYGAWDAAELADDAQNLQRLLWIACGDVVEEHVA